MVLTEQFLGRMVRAIVEAINPERIYVFGSHARGAWDVHSDLDFLIVSRKSFGPENSRRRELSKVRNALSSFRISKDILLYSREEIDRWKRSTNHIVAHCLKDGKLVYEQR